MKKNNIGYLLREGFRGVFLHGFMSFAAICVTVACLIIMGSFCLILYNTSAMVKELEQKNEMLVYIDELFRGQGKIRRFADQPHHQRPLRGLCLAGAGTGGFY